MDRWQQQLKHTQSMANDSTTDPATDSVTDPSSEQALDAPTARHPHSNGSSIDVPTTADEGNSGHVASATHRAVSTKRPMKELYNVEFCGQRPGVPIGVNVRVIAISNADARRQAKALLKPFWEGFELFKHYRGYADDGESCRIYIDCDLIAKRCSVDVEDDGIDWNAEQDDTGGVFVEDGTEE